MGFCPAAIALHRVDEGEKNENHGEKDENLFQDEPDLAQFLHQFIWLLVHHARPSVEKCVRLSLLAEVFTVPGALSPLNRLVASGQRKSLALR